MIQLDERTSVDSVPIELDGESDQTAPVARPSRPSWPALVAIVILTAVLTGAAAAAGNRGAPTPPAAAVSVPVLHTVELQLSGEGVGQLARVWTPTAVQDVPAWGTSGRYPDPRAVIYVVQAGLDGSAECAIVIDGREVSRQTASPLETATCWWIA